MRLSLLPVGHSAIRGELEWNHALTPYALLNFIGTAIIPIERILNEGWTWELLELPAPISLLHAIFIGGFSTPS